MSTALRFRGEVWVFEEVAEDDLCSCEDDAVEGARLDFDSLEIFCDSSLAGKIRQSRDWAFIANCVAGVISRHERAHETITYRKEFSGSKSANLFNR
jgi:PHP family Zn ribbon phosphoesterase